MKINEINRVHLSAGNGGEAVLQVIQSAHSEAPTETDELERQMKVRNGEVRARGRDGGNKAADKRQGTKKQMKVKAAEKERPGG